MRAFTNLQDRVTTAALSLRMPTGGLLTALAVFVLVGSACSGRRTDDESACFTSPTPSCLYKVAIVATDGMASEKFRNVMLSGIAQSAAEVGEIDLATQTAERIREGDDQDAAFTSIAVALGKLGRFDQALAIAMNLQKQMRKDYAYEEIAVAQAEAGNIDAAHRTASLIEAIDYRKQTLERLHQIARTGSETMVIMGYQEPRPGEAEARALVEGAPSLDAALELAHNLSDRTEKSEAVALIAVSKARGGDVAEALGIASEIEPVPSCSDVCDTRHDLAIAEIAGIEAALGDRSGALATANGLGVQSRGNALVAIAKSEMDDPRRLPTQAIGTAELVHRPDLRATVFMEIALAVAWRAKLCKDLVVDRSGEGLKCP